MTLARIQAIEDTIMNIIPISSRELFDSFHARGMKKKSVQRVIKKLERENKVVKRGNLQDMRTYTLVEA